MFPTIDPLTALAVFAAVVAALTVLAWRTEARARARHRAALRHPAGRALHPYGGTRRNGTR